MEPIRSEGEVVELVGLIVESRGPAAAIGDFCEIRTRSGRSLRTQVIGFRRWPASWSMPLEETDGPSQLGDRIVARGGRKRPRRFTATARPRTRWIRRQSHGWRPAHPRHRDSPPFHHRASQPARLAPTFDERLLTTGIRAIDGLLPCGKGQRIGIFGGSGVGKSTLLGSMARSGSAGVNVIALIGERNREVREFLEHDLGAEGMKTLRRNCARHFRPARAAASSRLLRRSPGCRRNISAIREKTCCS